MKPLLYRVFFLLLTILLCSGLSWVCIYAFFIGVRLFHNVAAARACAALGDFLLTPAHFIFARLGGDQSALFFDPTSYSVTNGLILGVVSSIVLRRLLARRHPKPPAAPAPQPRVEAHAR